MVASGGDVGEGDIATVGSVEITQAQFEKLIARARKTTRRATKFPKPGSADYDRIKAQAVSFLVQKAEFAQEAEKMGITISDQEIQKRLKEIKKQYFNNKRQGVREAAQGPGPDTAGNRVRLKDQLTRRSSTTR